MPANNIVPLLSPKGNLSKLHKQFNAKTKSINKLKHDLATLKEVIPAAKHAINEDINPLHKLYGEKKAALMHVFCNALNGKGLTKKERNKLEYIVQNMAFDLVKLYGLVEYKNIYDSFSEVSYDAAAAEEVEELKRMITEMLRNLGFTPDMSDWDFNNPSEIAAKLAEQHEEMFNAVKAKNEEDLEKKDKKKTAAQLAKEAKMLAEKKQTEQDTQKSIKEIYNQLVKAFHPDAEMDNEKKAQKTEIMKQITVAYNDDDLFTLLKLQIELEIIDDDKLAEFSDTKIKNFISVLSEQISRLNMEIEAIKQSVLISDKFNDWKDILHKPENYIQTVKNREKEVKKQIIDIDADIEAFQNSVFLKIFLKSQPTREEDEFPIDDFLRFFEKL